jgi:hypothetical protein
MPILFCFRWSVMRDERSENIERELSHLLGSSSIFSHLLLPQRTDRKFFLVRNSLMILPQVHLRKPCYDFYFL